MNLEQYQEFVIYNNFYTKYKEKTYTDITDNIENINSTCLNKNFILILIFEKWVNSQEVATYLETKGGVYIQKSVPFTINFLDVDIYPFDDIWDRFLLFDIRSVMKIFNNLNLANNSKINEIYNFILDEMGKKHKNIVFRKYYLNKNAKEIKKADTGLYIDLINLFNGNVKEYLVEYNKYKKTFTGGSLINEFLNEIEKIKKIKINDLASFAECISISNKLNIISGKIISFFQLIVNYIIDLYKQIKDTVNSKTKNSPQEDINILIKKNKEEKTFTVEQLLKTIKPLPSPQFKKSYIVRENNLNAYIEIRMLYYVKNNKEFIKINNFNIPYNNIIDLEHNITNQMITVNLIDTEGELSELLIYKMYQITTQISESKKINNINVEESMPYVFEIEYGWAGPETEDEEELLKEKVYVKKKYRGYIKSISSQFSNIGTRYTLEIMPLNYENNFFDANYYKIFYSNDIAKQSSSFSISLFVLYLILKHWSDINLKTIVSTNGEYAAGDIQLEKIFYMIKNHEVNIFEYVTGNTKSYEIASVFTKNNVNNPRGLILTKKITDANDVSVIEKLLKSVTSKTHTERVGNNNFNFKYYETFSIGIESIKNIGGSLNSDFKLNAWLVAAYLIWELQDYFTDRNRDFYLLHDTTGLFSFFNSDINSNNLGYLGKNRIWNDSFYNTINKFNVFCFEKNITVNENNFFELMKTAITNDKYNKYNQYYIYDIYDNNAKSTDKDIKRKLTFFNKKIQEIFGKIDHLGHDKPYDENNVYQLTKGINADFSTFKDLDINYYAEILNDYKKKIYADQNIIYLEDSVKDKKREEISYIKFREKFINVAKELAVVNSEKDFKPFNAEQDPLQSIKRERELLEKKKDMFLKNKIEENEELTKGKDINILYLSYNLNKNTIMANTVMPLEKKISFLSKNIMQSYSLKPKMSKKTRNSNKQFFSQGNDNLLLEGTGDIIEFSPVEFDIGKIDSLNKEIKNLVNVNFDDFFNSTYTHNMYENAAKYYNTYVNIDGKIDKTELIRNIAQLKINYQKQLTVKATITIIGEPFWSNVDFVNRSCFIYLHIYHNSGSISDYTGLYTVENVVQNIQNAKFLTNMEIIRVPTFLNNFDVFLNKNFIVGKEK